MKIYLLLWLTILGHTKSFDYEKYYHLPRRLNPSLLKMKVGMPQVYTSSTPMLNNPNMEVNDFNEIEYNKNKSKLHPKVVIKEQKKTEKLRI